MHRVLLSNATDWCSTCTPGHLRNCIAKFNSPDLISCRSFCSQPHCRRTAAPSTTMLVPLAITCSNHPFRQRPPRRRRRHHRNNTNTSSSSNRHRRTTSTSNRSLHRRTVSETNAHTILYTNRHSPDISPEFIDIPPSTSLTHNINTPAVYSSYHHPQQSGPFAQASGPVSQKLIGFSPSPQYQYSAQQVCFPPPQPPSSVHNIIERNTHTQ